MRVLLLKDVYKLGHAGDVKRVANGYGRNYLLPQGMAVLATAGAMRQVESIKSQATLRRAALNKEMGSIDEVLKPLTLGFASKAGETGKLYGSITQTMIAEAIEARTGIKIERRQIEVEPIRTLGEHKAHIRLTVDLVPEIKIIVHREGEVVPGLIPTPVKAAPAPKAVPAVTEAPVPVAAPVAAPAVTEAPVPVAAPVAAPAATEVTTPAAAEIKVE